MDYSMIEYCIKDQTNALNTIRAFPNDEIKRRCVDQWDRDYSMIEYCYREQSGAKRRLGIESSSPSPKEKINRTLVPCQNHIIVGSQKKCL